VHGILETIETKPIEPVVFEGRDPATWQISAIVGRTRRDGAFFVPLPLLDAMTARVSIRIDVDRNAKKVIGDFPLADGVLGAKPTNGSRLVVGAWPVTLTFDAMLDAAEDRRDLFMHDNR